MPLKGHPLPNPVITEAEAAQFLTISLPHLRKLRRAGRGPKWIRLAERRIGYRQADLEAWLDERQRAAEAERSPAA